MTETIIVSLISAMTGSGFCSIVLYLIQRHDKKTDTQTAGDQKKDEELQLQSEMLLGLGHDRIVHLGSFYVERGYITKDEYENLHDYLYHPYKALGGNGTVERIMKEVESLPLRKGV